MPSAITAQPGQNFCNTPQAASRDASGRYRAWAKGMVVTWGIEQAPPGITTPDYRELVKAGFAAWAKWGGVLAEYRSNPKNVNIVLGTQAIDGPSGILAQAELPGYHQSSGTLGCWADSSERRWVIAEKPDWSAGEVDALRVIWHELGHNLGLDHAPQDGSPADLMDPRVGDLREPQSDWDGPQCRFRYGPPAGQPPTKPPTEKPPSLSCADLFRGILIERINMSDEDRDLLRDIRQAWKDSSGSSEDDA